MNALDAAMTGHVLPVLAAYGAAAVTPGASVLVVARTSLSSGRLRGAVTALGVALGTALYASASLFGVSALVLRLPAVLRVLQVGGALYLAWLGIRLFVLRRVPILEGAASGSGSAGAFGQGLLTNLSNPHTVIFFVGIFSTMLGPSIPLGERALLLVAIIAMSVTWYTTVAIALSSVQAQDLYRRSARGIDVVAGTIMLWLAVRSALSAIR